MIGRDGLLAEVEPQHRFKHHAADETYATLTGLARAATPDLEALTEQAGECVRRLEAHMAQEEDLLLPMLESILDEALDQELVLKMAAIQRRFA